VLKIAHAALLHDVGKCQIDTSIVNCPGKLSPEQWQEMKRHPVYGHTILQKNPDMDSIALDVTRHHHEKLTGDGYPDGLTSKEISAQVRICTIADIFDALTTRRVYKEAIISFEALKLMRLEMAQSLDFGFLKCFIEMLAAPACA
jgi:HD-GYP domain-containing protein (c-di-GMP phosphodiesterase class II)